MNVRFVDINGNLSNVCAFASEDDIRKKSSKAWKQQYVNLKWQY